jgi:DNA sulfur modification protein DndE
MLHLLRLRDISGTIPRWLTISFNRVRISEDATQKLSTLKRRTGLTPNILSRIGFCLSLKEPGQPNMKRDSHGQEFNRFVLFGEWDAYYIALLKMRLINDRIEYSDNILPILKEHIERGIVILFNRVRHFRDLSTLGTKS